ncbi:hypothetical protein BDY24DRAFT_402762 [Mrakia frigida]|uniref:uncharacterized protein n=1 Tax=Mrakia frigida TaxID=29902 RepID=UPI003FCC0D04
MGFNSPVPVKLPDECRKATKILSSFLKGSNGGNGLDKVIPRHVLESAKGFCIFTVVKAGFLVSARAGSGIVIARLPDGNWSAPSAIGTAGVGFGGQAGAEVTDFLIVLNSRSGVESFMSAGSLSLGGNMSLAVGPLGRNAEGSGNLSTKGKVAAMYSYSKTKGLFGGVSLEGSVIVERQDANRIAYQSPVTAKQLLSGVIPVPAFAEALIQRIESATGLPGGQTWVQDSPLHSPALDDFAGDRYGSRGSPSSIGHGGGSSYGFPGIGSNGNAQSSTMGRARSGSLLSGRKRGDSVSSIKAEAAAAGRSESPTKNGSPSKPGLFKSMSFRGRGSSKGSVDAPEGYATTSEAYNNQMDSARSRPESTYISSSTKPAFNDLSGIAHPSPQRTRASSTASTAPAFATHFESNFSSEDVGSGSKGGDLMTWDDEAPRRSSPSSHQQQQPRSSTQYSSFAEEPDRSSFDDGHQFSNSSRPINTSSYPYQNYDSGSLTPSKKKSRPFSSFLPRSSSFTSNSNSNSPAPPSPIYRNEPEPELKAEEDWGVLGEKARMGINRTRSGSGSQMLSRAGSTPLERTEEALERGDMGAEFKNVPGVVARGVAVFDFKGVEAGDLSFKRGDVILITQKTEKKQDWWTGQVGTNPQRGVFPGNYIELVRS